MVMMSLITSVLILHSWDHGLDLSLPLCHFYWHYGRGSCFPSWHPLQEEVWELEVLFYAQRNSECIHFKIWVHSFLFWTYACIVSTLDRKSREVLQGFAVWSSLELSCSYQRYFREHLLKQRSFLTIFVSAICRSRFSLLDKSMI